jgi:putative aldouronate transport system substrate-binding protein
MYKKQVSFLLILILAMSTLLWEVGYSKPLVKKPITLTFMCEDTENPAHSLKKETPLTMQWWEEATGIHIEPIDVILTQDYTNVLQLKAAAGQINTDIVEIRGDSTGNYITQYVKSGLIIPLNDLIDKYAPNIKAFMKRYPQYKEILTLPDGKIYSIGTALASRYAYMGIMIRKDWLDKLGLKMPNTLEDWYKTAIAFVKDDPNGNGKADELGMISGDKLFGLYEFGLAYDLHLCIEGGWHIRDGKLDWDFIRPEAKDFLRFLNRCVKDGAVAPDFNDPTLTPFNMSQRVYDGLVGMIVRYNGRYLGFRGGTGNVWDLVNPGGPMMVKDPKARWVMAPPPLPINPKERRMYILESIANRWRTYAITSKCKDPVAAIKWLDFVFASKEGINILRYGKEGLTYIHKPDGSIEMLVKLTPTNEIADGPLAGKWFGGVTIGNVVPTIEDDALVLQRMKESETPQWAIDSLKTNLKYATQPFLLPILPLEEGKEVAKLYNDIKTYKDEMWAKFVAGDIPITDENFNNYVNTIKKMGIDKVIEMYQKAYDNRSK